MQETLAMISLCLLRPKKNMTADSRMCFKDCVRKNITLNKSKCEFNKNSVEFFGYCFSAEGVSADPKKIDAIKSATAPQNAGELRSLLGLANYVSRFIPDFATIVAPLRTLTHQNTTWQLGKKEQSALKELKRNSAVK